MRKFIFKTKTCPGPTRASEHPTLKYKDEAGNGKVGHPYFLGLVADRRELEGEKSSNKSDAGDGKYPNLNRNVGIENGVHMSAEIYDLRSRVLEGMRGYMAACLQDGHGPGYTGEDIDKCKSIVDTFLKSLSEASKGDEEAVMAAVKAGVLALNNLNAVSGYSLIETDQREDLAMLIIKAAESVGVGDGSKDITEEWRKW